MRKAIPALLMLFVCIVSVAGEPAPIALVEGLTITTAIAERDGDYESIKRITERRKDAWLLSYSASLPAEGTPRIVAAERILHDADLVSARTYRNQFEDGVEEDYPGTTALGASTQVLDELKRTGVASFSLVGEEMALVLMANRNLKYRGELQRRAGGVTSVLVNGQVVSLTVVIAAGRFSARQGKTLDVEFSFLDGAVPIALQWRIGEASLRVVRIDSPAKQSTLARELATKKRAIIPGLHFDFGSAVLRPESNAALPAVVAAIRESGGVFRLEGHTDAIGDEAKNQSLSRARAESVRAALIKLDASLASRLSAQGLGESRPLGNNATLEGRALNRRVELVSAAASS